VVALLMESCLLATSIASALVLSAEADKEKMAPLAALMNLGLEAGYGSAIALTRHLAEISRTLPGERVPNGKRDARMAVVLGTATLLGATPTFLLIVEPSSEGSLFSIPLPLVIFFAIFMAISGVGHFLWFLSYAKSLLSWHRALRDTGSRLFPPTPVGCDGANAAADPGLSPEGGPRT
jgi:hypothetical protein